MLSELCQELRNWFSEDEDKHFGTFTISGGVITPSDFLRTNQYFRIQGSLFNDGVHQLGAQGDTLTDEVFEGTVTAMAIPKAFLDLANEISSWITKYGDAMNSPYQSESFGGYSYSKAADGANGATWQKVFKSRLNAWRKI